MRRNNWRKLIESRVRTLNAYYSALGMIRNNQPAKADIHSWMPGRVTLYQIYVNGSNLTCGTGESVHDALSCLTSELGNVYNMLHESDPVKYPEINWHEVRQNG